MQVLTVSRFVQAIRDYLREGLGPIAIQGEVTNFRERSGNLVFFELKDTDSRILCFLLRGELKVPMEDGLEIRILGTPSLFQKSGQFYVRVQTIELVGEGALKKAFLGLWKKLEKEGIFAQERKRPLPRFPERIGLITSPDAAAYTDVLRILQNRWSGLTIRFFPVAVQGVESVPQILRAFEYFNREENVDVIILTRGGGSLEDLQSFNSEDVVRVVFSSSIPVICGVGHERDVTLADLAADVRASTPSNAAELTVPSREEVLLAMTTNIRTVEEKLLHALECYEQDIDRLLERLEAGRKRWQTNLTHLLEKLEQHIRYVTEWTRWTKGKLTAQLLIMEERFIRSLTTFMGRIEHDERLLHSLSPEATLKRGYSLTIHLQKKTIVRDSREVKIGDAIETRLAHGNIRSEIQASS